MPAIRAQRLSLRRALKTTPPKRKKLHRTRRALIAFAVLFLFAYYLLPFVVPLPKSLDESPDPGLGFIDRHGQPLRKSLAGDGQRRFRALTYDQLPSVLIDATLAAEDKRFFSHGGIDFLALARASWDSLRAGRTVSGASTITQQLIKISRQRSPRTIPTKLYEMLAARKLEMLWDKKRILTEYLNRLDYGNLRTGASAAAWGYFEKPAADLSTAEAAFLAGLPQAPGRLNPYNNADDADKRRLWVLGEMERSGKIDDDLLAAANSEPLVLRRFSGGYEAPHAVDLLLAQNLEPDLYGTVETTIDLGLQRAVETALREELAKIDAKKNATNAAAIVIENATGKIRALVGSRDYFDPRGGQVNGALAPRSPGSALKPFVYLLALESGTSPAEVIADLPVTFSSAGGQYSPVNYDRKFHGPVTLRDALACSLNVSAVKLANRIGGPLPIIEKLRAFGITTLTESPNHYGLGLAIGGAEIRLLELAGAYAALARRGSYLPPTLTPRPTGETNAASTVCSPANAYLIADILSDNAARSRAFGRHSAIALPFRAAAKTGTSTDFRDNWTLGFTPEFTVGVWVGNFDNSSMQHVSGVTGAGPIFRAIFLHLDRHHDLTWFSKPDGLVEILIDPRTGHRVDHLEIPPTLARREIVPADRIPPPASSSDYSPDGAAILAPEFAEWISGGDNWLGASVTAATYQESAPTALRITHPARNATIYLDPDLPNGGSLLPLESNASPESTITWESPTLTIREDTTAQLTPGRHQITATDPRSNQSATVWISVEEL